MDFVFDKLSQLDFIHHNSIDLHALCWGESLWRYVLLMSIELNLVFVSSFMLCKLKDFDRLSHALHHEVNFSIGTMSVIVVIARDIRSVIAF